MSVMLCAGCDALIDTDFDVGGIWEPEFRCEPCTEALAEEPCETDADCGKCLPCMARKEFA